MPPTLPPTHLRHLAAISSQTQNKLTQLVSRQGLEAGTEGPPGPSGPAGPPGATFVHTEGAPSETWVIKHELKLFPSVTVIDTAGEPTEGIVEYVSNEELVIVFSANVVGTAYLN